MSEHKPPTDEELAEWKALREAATPGPWGRIKRHPTWIYDGALSSIGSMDSEKDTLWVVAACAGLPLCIEEINRLRVALAREVKHWTASEQEIGGHVAEIRRLRMLLETKEIDV